MPIFQNKAWHPFRLKILAADSVEELESMMNALIASVFSDDCDICGSWHPVSGVTVSKAGDLDKFFVIMEYVP